MSVAGKFSTMSMADLIQWARTAQRTGLLTLTDEGGKEIQVVFRDGRIVFSSNNDKRERWRAYLLYHGFCTEEVIEAAFREKEAGGASVASILVRQRRITAEQAISTLTEKTMEDVCDAFLWKEGSFAFEPKPLAVAHSLAIDLDPINVVCEGVRRAEIWNRLNAYIHPNSFYDRTREALDPSGTWEDLRMAQHVWMHVEPNLSVSELVASLPFSRFKIYRALSELLERRLIATGEATATADREKRIGRKRQDASAAAEAGRWTEAMEILQGLVTANPGRADLTQELISLTRGFERAVHEHNFTKDDVPVVTIGPEALGRLNLYPMEAFLLSRIDGRLAVRDILRITPISEFDGLRAFKRLLSAKVIDFPMRTTAVEPLTAVPAR
jgi:hypothetical protein